MTVLLAPILLGSCVYFVLPNVPDADVLRVRWSTPDHVSSCHQEILDELNKIEPVADPVAALALYRKEAASIIAGWSREEDALEFNNPFSGLPYIEEDSPGNYLIELKAGKPTYFRFDMNGQKIELGEIGEKARSKSDER